MYCWNREEKQWKTKSKTKQNKTRKQLEEKKNTKQQTKTKNTLSRDQLLITGTTLISFTTKLHYKYTMSIIPLFESVEFIMTIWRCAGNVKRNTLLIP